MNNAFRTKRRKYSTKKLINHILVNNFLKKNKLILSKISFESILDVGCGEGMFIHYNFEIFRNKYCCAIDIDEKEIETAKSNISFCELKVGSIYNIPYSNDSFDIVVCTEVFEHLDNPELAINEIHRVTKNFVLLSVPNEPLWRILNLSRLAYIKSFGNTPGHLNHWSSKSFKNFVGNKFKVIETVNPIPWTIILAKK